MMQMSEKPPHMVGLEHGPINDEGTIETEGGTEGRVNLGDTAIQVRVCGVLMGALNVERTTANIEQHLIAKPDGGTGVL
jgi:hypothetical protein